MEKLKKFVFEKNEIRKITSERKSDLLPLRPLHITEPLPAILNDSITN